MPFLKNFVTVDWRSGKDGIHFFFKDINKYSRYSLGDRQVPKGYPSDISYGNWNDFHSHAKNLRFGLTTTDLINESEGYDSDATWLFFYEGTTPTVCKYNQDTDRVSYIKPVENTGWAPILPYFDRIIAVTWWTLNETGHIFKFIMSDGKHFQFNYKSNYYNQPSISPTVWSGLSPYLDRIITGVQKDSNSDDNYFYIFLTGNEYIIYNLQMNRMHSGPHPVNEVNWPGLLRD